MPLQLTRIFYRLNLTHPQKIAVLAVLTGIVSGLLGIALKSAAHHIYNFLTHNIKLTALIIILPAVGILLSRFSWHYTLGSLQKGLSGVLYAIARNSGIIRTRSIWVNPITAAITAGFGGSAGLEAPIVATSAAIGSGISQRYRLTYHDRILLISAGTAAGIASVFNAPIAGVMFAIEILLPELTVSNFIPLMFAAAAGALCSNIILHENILINFSMKETFSYLNLPHYLLLGIICGLFSIHYIRMTGKVENLLNKTKSNVWRSAAALLLLITLCYVFPALRGEGMSGLKALASGNASALLASPIFTSQHFGISLSLLALLSLALLKPLTAALTIQNGGNGGNFGPSLLVGGIVGYAYCHIAVILGANSLPESNFVIVAMAGMLSGIMHAPLTAIFLIAEISGGYGLFIPLLIVVSLSYLTSRQWEPHAVDTRNLALQNDLLTHDSDKNALLQMNIAIMIETDIATIRPEKTVDNLVALIRKNKRNIFAVLEKSGSLSGIVYLDDVKNIIFDTRLRKRVKIFEVMKSSPAVIQHNDSVEAVLDKFEKTASWNLPVVKNGKYLGFISKARIFDEYRNKIIKK